MITTMSFREMAVLTDEELNTLDSALWNMTKDLRAIQSYRERAREGG